MSGEDRASRPDGEVLSEVNRRFYDALWSGSELVDPSRFNTWPLVTALAEDLPRRLEVGPGMRPRLPVPGTHFADISLPALASLSREGGHAVAAPVGNLPYSRDSFDLVCALDIIEHVEDDDGALAELARVARPGATVLLSTPLHPEYWTPFDDIVGHYRRYEPARLAGLLRRHGLTVEKSAVFGMKPRSSPLLDLGMWFLQNRPHLALPVYNRILMPLALKRQKPLALCEGMVGTDGVDEVFLVCRR